MKMLLLVLLSFGSTTIAQFYAPATDFHDPCQRRFPVEAARVMAWNLNAAAAGAGTAEVAFRLESAPGAETRWVIQWKDAKGAVTREAVVRYSPESLLTGPDWYRSVWRQLAGKPSPAGGGAFTAADFWKGADGSGVSRMEGVSAALKQTKARRIERAADAARLAGILAQSAVPGIDTMLTIDGALTSRAAAWLCLAEDLGRASFPETWAPIVTLAGRHPLAADLWATRKAPLTLKVERFWDVLSRFPAATEALPYIAQEENRRYALPLFCAYGHDDLVVELGRALTGGRWDRQHDYGVSLNHSSGSRPPVARDFPVRVLRASVKVLRELPPQPNDGEKARALAAQVKDFDSPKNDLAKPSVTLIELLNVGAADVAGPLVPVAVATARDISGFAWELAGLQLGTIHHHLATRGGLQKEAPPLAEAWLLPVQDWPALFSVRSIAREEPRDTGRAEFILSYKVAARLIETPPKAWRDAQDPATVYFRRRWLLDSHRGLEFFMARKGNDGAAAELLRRAAQQAAPWALEALLLDQAEYPEYIEAHGLRAEIARALPRSVVAARALASRPAAAGEDPFTQAQAFERLHWDTGVAISPPELFARYVRVNALECAKRVHDQMGEAMVDRYEYQRGVAAGRLAIAVMENDEDAILQLASIASPSKVFELTGAIFENDLGAARRHVEEWLKRYAGARGQAAYEQLRDYLPLIPALADRKHADHGRALDTFPRRSFLFLQWVLLRKAKLNTEDAIRFLGGEHADSEQAVLIAALRKDRAAFETAYQNAGSSRDSGRNTLFAMLRHELLGTAPPKDQPDLRPPGRDFLLFTLRRILAEK